MKIHNEAFNFNSKGQILLLALVMFSIISVLGAVMASMWRAEIEARDQEKRSLTAFYLAQAGAEEAKACLKSNSNCSSCNSGSGTLGGSNYSFSYNVSGCTGTSRTITSTGEVEDGVGNSLAVRRIQVLVQGIGGVPSQIPGSWNEQ